MPATASVCAMPLPITPAPITPTLTSATVLSSAGFAPAAPREQSLAQAVGGVAIRIGLDGLREMAERAAHLGPRRAAEQVHHRAPIERERRRRSLGRGLERGVDRSAQPLDSLARGVAFAAHRDL